MRTLYNWIATGVLSVAYHYLLYHQYRKLKKQHITQPKHILGLSIEEGPESINDRSEYGHWEMDTVILTKEKSECLLTLTERKTRLEIIRLIPDKTTQSVNQALREIDFSVLLEGFSYAYGIDWLEEFFNENQDKLRKYY